MGGIGGDDCIFSGFVTPFLSDHDGVKVPALDGYSPL